MGLSICRSIIDAHGGRLWADVNAPRGAVFQFTLPGAERKLTNSLRRLTRLESCAKTPYQMLFINRLTEVTNDPIVQGAGPVNVIGVGSNEDRRNRVPCIDEVSVEFEPGHRRHMDVGDQAGRFDETRGCEEIGCRRESLGGIAQRPHEPSHELRERTDHHQRPRPMMLSAYGSPAVRSNPPCGRRPTMRSRPHADSTNLCQRMRGEAMPVARKLWLMRGGEFRELARKMPPSRCRGA